MTNDGDDDDDDDEEHDFGRVYLFKNLLNHDISIDETVTTFKDLFSPPNILYHNFSKSFEALFTLTPHCCNSALLGHPFRATIYLLT